MNMKIRITQKNKLMMVSVVIRVIALCFILLCADKLPSLGFIGNTPDYDDYRYEQGAYLYSQEANSIIDVDTFTSIFDSMGDWTGHHLQPERWLIEGCLWYWIICILTYITKFRYVCRILNIILAAFITKYIYEITSFLYSHKAARIAALIFAIFPYTVIFSCFSYKDTLVCFCIFYILLFFVKAKHNMPSNKIKMIIVCLLFILLRSGVSELFIGLCVIYYCFEGANKITFKKFVNGIILIVIGLLVMFISSDVIFFKFYSYIGNTSTTDLLGGSLVKITNIKDIWKLPLTLSFCVLQPIGFTFKNVSWYTIVSRLNILMIPILISFIFEFLINKRKDKALSVILLVFYAICSVSSVLIFRQLYSIWPIPVIYASNFLSEKKKTNIVLIFILSIVLTISIYMVMR